VRRTSRAGFVEFDWFSIDFGKLLNISESKKLEFSRRNLLGKAQLVRFSKMRGANIFQNARPAKSLSTNL
jgi:hypothetical protein